MDGAALLSRLKPYIIAIFFLSIFGYYFTTTCIAYFYYETITEVSTLDKSEIETHEVSICFPLKDTLQESKWDQFQQNDTRRRFLVEDIFPFMKATNEVISPNDTSEKPFT